LSAILQFLKLLYEHKEKIILGALVVAFIGVGAVLWKKEEKTISPEPGGGKKTSVRKAKTYPIMRLGNRHPLDILIENTDMEIFAPSAVVADKGGGKKGKEDVWAEVKIKSVFDATRSGSFIAIIEVNKKRMFVKEGERFQGYSVTRIDGVRKCLTIVKRGSQKGDEEKEFCIED
jgi:hypothetical protein